MKKKRIIFCAHNQDQHIYSIRHYMEQMGHGLEVVPVFNAPGGDKSYTFRSVIQAIFYGQAESVIEHQKEESHNKNPFTVKQTWKIDQSIHPSFPRLVINGLVCYADPYSGKNIETFMEDMSSLSLRHQVPLVRLVQRNSRGSDWLPVAREDYNHIIEEIKDKSGLDLKLKIFN